MYDEFETGISMSDYVKVEVFDQDEKKTTLTVNPVGQFNPGGCTAFISVKKDVIMSLKTTRELYDYFLGRIIFENLESAVDLENTRLIDLMEYTKDLEPDEGNEWWLSYFKRLEKKVAQFHDELTDMAEDLRDLKKVVIHQYHEAGGELCDFVDFICVPEGEDEDVLREFFEENLSPDSEIDQIMELFEDGCSSIDSFCADEKTVVDFRNGTLEKTMIVTDVR